jgi:hypothetical protein
MATHNLELVRRADLRVIELDRGRVVCDAVGAFAPGGDGVSGAHAAITPPGADT